MGDVTHKLPGSHLDLGTGSGQFRNNPAGVHSVVRGVSGSPVALGSPLITQLPGLPSDEELKNLVRPHPH